MKTLAYLRVSGFAQDVKNQKFEILEYAQKNNLKIDEFIEIEISSRKDRGERRIDELFSKLTEDSILIVSELSRLGRSTVEVITMVNT
jgi:DNA invertase Pin-like site-specific DNA recombinase